MVNDHAAGRVSELAEWHAAYGEFRERFTSHCKDILAGRECGDTQDILERLDDAVLAYPAGKELMPHRYIFMDFCKMVNAFLRWDGRRSDTKMANALMELCSSIGDAFARGALLRGALHGTPFAGAEYDAEIAGLDRAVRKMLKESYDIMPYDYEICPEVEDMVLHPEKHKFTPVPPGAYGGGA